jgi:hypothetical protein
MERGCAVVAKVSHSSSDTVVPSRSSRFAMRGFTRPSLGNMTGVGRVGHCSRKGNTPRAGS